MNTLQGVVTDDGLASAPADLNPPNDQIAPVAVSRDGQVAIRLTDAAGFPEGQERYTTHHEVVTNPGALVTQVLVSDRTCRLQECEGYANGAANLTDFYYLGFYDKAQPVVANDVPVLEWPVEQNRGAFSLAYEHRFETGLVVALSTTQGKFTAGANVLWTAVKVLRD
jgi:hypothetical protein